MTEPHNFKIGDNVIKFRRFSPDKYCKHGGAEKDVPLGTKGKITHIYPKDSTYGEQSLEVKFKTLGHSWTVDASELELNEKYKPLPAKPEPKVTKQELEKSREMLAKLFSGE